MGVSADSPSFKAGRVGSEPQTDGAIVSRRRAVDSDEEAKEAGVPFAGGNAGSGNSESTLVDGFCFGPDMVGTADSDFRRGG